MRYPMSDRYGNCDSFLVSLQPVAGDTKESSRFASRYTEIVPLYKGKGLRRDCAKYLPTDQSVPGYIGKKN